MKKPKRAVVLLSGGQDSATCLAIAKADCDSVIALAFDYGQRHAIELDCAQALAMRADVPFHTLDLSFISTLSQNALTRHDLPIVHQDALPSTFVPGRNLFFLSAAAVFATQMDCYTLYTGVCQTDFSGYPDCRDAFIRSAQQTISLALDQSIDIQTPLMFLTKSETVLKMQDLDCLSWYQDTHTCYEGKRPACGYCPACQLRLKGFQDAGISDPISYQ